MVISNTSKGDNKRSTGTRSGRQALRAAPDQQFNQVDILGVHPMELEVDDSATVEIRPLGKTYVQISAL
nr:hypothetical protein [Tanacetum cinerariifolium]